jgi:hypothetical protein
MHSVIVVVVLLLLIPTDPLVVGNLGDAAMAFSIPSRVPEAFSAPARNSDQFGQACRAATTTLRSSLRFAPVAA